ncbi:MAG: M28 family peptidase [Bryobacteraceae bacterium]|nr:M28 family peptidase [Bryobacteraceae bacterium]
MKRLIQISIAVALTAQTFAAPGETRLASVIGAVAGEVNNDRAMEYMHEVYARDRWFTFPKFDETARYLARVMDSAGLSAVEVVPAPADGVSRTGHWTAPLAWDVKDARLEVLEPAPPEEFRTLADYQKAPASLAMWSGPTPAGGVTAEVVDIGKGKRSEIEKLDLRGKIAMTSARPSGIKWLLAKKGALGVINTDTENPDLKDSYDWVNSWGDKGWGLTKGDSTPFCFSVTPRQAEWLRGQMADGKTVRVKATVDSRLYEGTYPYATGVLRGTGSEEEVLTLGHTAEQGAQDNATGVAAMVEALSTLERLVASGKLPRPRRSIRLLAMGEVYGSMHYIQENPERIRNTVAAICIDTPAGFYHLAKTEYTFYLNPHVAKSYVDAFTMRLAKDYFSRVGRPFHEAPYMMGTDSFLSDPTIGTPTVWPYSSSGVHTHHNSADTPDHVDPRSLKDLTVVTAAFLYFLASADEADAAWLAELALSRGYGQIAASVEPFLDRAFSAPDIETLSRILHDGLEKLDYSAGRERQAVESVRRLAPGVDVGPAVRRIDEFRSAEAARLRDAVNRRASSLRLAQAVKPVPPKPDPKLAGAEKLIVRRKSFGTLPLDDLPVDQREGWPSGAWDTRLATALYWCDGKRNLAEVVRLTRLELGPDDFDFAGYFQFLGRKGHVELAQQP